MTETLQRQWPDWFTGTYARQFFERHLLPLAGQPDLRFLQIGAYCGDASVWMTENVLTGPDCLLVDVDTWEGSRESAHSLIDFDAVFDYYLRRIGVNVSWLRATSDTFFRQHWQTARYDFVYIDGSHETRQVLRDAVNAEQVLKPGGLIAFDDYHWSDGTRNVPRPAIDAFLRCYEDTVEVLEVGLQVWCRKKGTT